MKPSLMSLLFTIVLIGSCDGFAEEPTTIPTPLDVGQVELHMISVTDGLLPSGMKRSWPPDNSHTQVNVRVTAEDTPIELFLRAENPVDWNISRSPRVRITRVVVSSNTPPSVNGLGSETQISASTALDPKIGQSPDKNYYEVLQQKALDIFGKTPITFQEGAFVGAFGIDGIKTSCSVLSKRKEMESRRNSLTSPRSLHTLRALMGSSTVADRVQAAERLRVHCESAVPLLAHLIMDQEPSVRSNAIDSLSAIGIGTGRFDPILRSLEDPDKNVRLRAIKAEESLRDIRAIPALVRLLKLPDVDLRLAAATALEKQAPENITMGLGIILKDSDVPSRLLALKPFISDFTAILVDPNPFIVISMCNVLRQLGESGRPGVPMLVKLLNHENQTVKKSAAKAIQGIGINSGEIVFALVNARQAAKDESWKDIDNAIGAADAKVMPELAQRLKDAASDSDRIGAVLAIRLVQKPYPPVIPDLVALSESRNSELTSQANLALSTVGNPGPEEISILIHFLSDPNPQVRLQSMKPLALAGSIASEAVTPLVDLINDPAPEVRAQVIVALKAIGATAIDKIVDQLVRTYGTRQLQLLNILGLMNEPLVAERAANAAPVLVMLSQHAEASVRRQASDLLIRLSTSAIYPLVAQLAKSQEPEAAYLRQTVLSMQEAAVPVLNQIIIDRKALLAVRLEACLLVGSMGDKGADAVRALIEALTDQQHELRARAAHTLGSIGPLASPAILPLVAALSDKNDIVRRSAVTALQQIGAEAFPALTQTVVGENETERLMASRVLTGVDLTQVHGPQRSQLVENLMSGLMDSLPEVRYRSAEALAHLHYPDSQVIEILLEELQDREFENRLRAIRALGKIAPAVLRAQAMLSLLATTDPSADVKAEAAVVLQRMTLFTDSETMAQTAPLTSCLSLDDRSELLQEAHAKALALYKSTDDPAKPLEILRSACAEQAATLQPPSLAKAEYVSLLNDMAFFQLELFKKLPVPEQQIRRAALSHVVVLLEKVVALAPRRAVAHLNLSEALTLRSQFYDFGKLVQHYKIYKTLSQRPLDEVGEWLAELPHTIDACHFVIALRNKGWLEDASAISDRGVIDIDNDGLMDRVGFNLGGTASASSLDILFGNPDKRDLPDGLREENYRYQPDTYGSKNVMVFGFKRKYYILNYDETVHGILLSHLEEIDAVGRKILCEFSNVAIESIPKALEKISTQLAKDVLRKTIKYGTKAKGWSTLHADQTAQLKAIAPNIPIQGLGIISEDGSVDIDNDGTPEEMALIKFDTPPAEPKELLVKWGSDHRGIPDDWINQLLIDQIAGGFSLRPFVWHGASYLEKRSNNDSKFSHEIIRLAQGKAEKILAFDIRLESQFSRYGKRPGRELHPKKDRVRILANISR